jgi:hypothetical protein
LQSTRSIAKLRVVAVNDWEIVKCCRASLIRRTRTRNIRRKRTRTRTSTSNINKLTSEKERIKDRDINKMIPKINCWLLALKSNQGDQFVKKEGRSRNV